MVGGLILYPIIKESYSEEGKKSDAEVAAAMAEAAAKAVVRAVAAEAAGDLKEACRSLASLYSFVNVKNIMINSCHLLSSFSGMLQ